VKEDVLRYFDLIKYLESDSLNESVNADKLIHRTFDILPANLKNESSNYIADSEFRSLIDKSQVNIKSYNAFCFKLLNLLIKKLEFKISYINEDCLDKTILSINTDFQSNLITDKIIIQNSAFILQNSNSNLIFSYSNQGDERLQVLSNHIFSIDKNKYENIHIIIFKNSKELSEARQVNKANVYKRSFFTSFDKICGKVIETDKNSYEKIFSIEWDYGINKHISQNIASLQNIDIIDNIPVGTEESRLYKLTFKTEDSLDILPGQFIMIDTLKERHTKISNRFKPEVRNSFSSLGSNIQNDLDSNRLSYLKRPFGIYRTYYENFSYDCSSMFDLGRELAAIMHTIKPNRFEILYKVLEKGVGTNELRKLVKNDKIEILAPLGKIFDLREILKEEIDEIHIVGGGVGIAPLVYLAQVLRFFSIKVKAFIGIEKYSSLNYLDTGLDPQSFTGSGRTAKIYVDDLKFLGLSGSSDIYMSFLSETEEQETIDIKNVFKGTVITDPYEGYIKKHHSLKILTFTCGPMPMMQKVHTITAQYDIKSYVLMEKRMGCGIGVCFSCVCKTIENGENHNSRVCIDGPIIESKQIDWNE
jgi:dihydroorotate dehydrogenase electron transfer subunit